MSHDRRTRPIGWSPGTGILIAAWIVGAAIARLTGATAVILILALTAVAFVFDVAAGWRASRLHAVVAVTAPLVVTVDRTCTLHVQFARLVTARAGERLRIIAHAPSERGNGAELVARLPFDATTNTTTLSTTFPAAGIIDQVAVRIEATGPGGLVWWRTRQILAVDDIHVAPVANGPLLDVHRASNALDGSVAAARGRHLGDVDGVRPWRHGDPIAAVHWPSSLRADGLVVHDRVTASDEHWLLDVDSGPPGTHPGPDTAYGETSTTPERVRWTLDEGRRLGHSVVARTTDGSTHVVHDAAAAAIWGARAAQAEQDRASTRAPESVGILQRQIRLRPARVESETALASFPRCAAAMAAFTSLAMLVGALDSSAITLALIAGALVVGAAASLAIARRSGKRPFALQVAIALAVCVAVVAIIVQAAEVHGLLAVLRGPMPDVLMLLVVLHGFEVIDRRTLRVHQAITLVIAAYAAGLRIDGALGWWLAAWGLAFITSVATTPRLDSSPTIDLSAATVTRWVAGTGAIAIATLGVLSIVPIPDGPARLGLPALSNNAPTAPPGALAGPDGTPGSNTTASSTSPDRGSIGGVVGYPGFTETLDTSIRGDLGDDVVMRVRAPEPAFWRGQTFSEFDGRVWTVSLETGQAQTGPTIDIQPTVGDAVGTTVPTGQLTQTYFVEQDLPNIVFAAARPTQLIFDGTVWTRPDGALRSDVTLTRGSVYTVVSERVQVTSDRLRSQGDLATVFAGFREAVGGQELDPFLELPATTTQRTIDLASRLRTPGESTYDTILAYEAWLGANTEYDLDAPVPAVGSDAVDDYLFESRRGFCEQIASTLAIMLRSQGVPARLVTGYVPGERDRVSGVWKVRASDAHAWVEVWFPETGWQAFDPTAQVPLAGEFGTSTVGGDLVAAGVASVSSHRVEIAGVLVGAFALWAFVRLIGVLRERRRRGRWGLLQDRFLRLGEVRADGDRARPTTNPHVAAHVETADRAVARSVADTLDRAAFDPTWVDDQQDYERTRTALATLERTRR